MLRDASRRHGWMDGERFEVCLRIFSPTATTTDLPARSQLYSEQRPVTRTPICPCSSGGTPLHDTRRRACERVRFTTLLRRQLTRQRQEKNTFPGDLNYSQMASGRRPRPKRQYRRGSLAVAKDRVANAGSRKPSLALQAQIEWGLEALARWREERGQS
jgi:hypothetical protein